MSLQEVCDYGMSLCDVVSPCGRCMFFWEEMCIWRWRELEEGGMSLLERVCICGQRRVLVGEEVQGSLSFREKVCSCGSGRVLEEGDVSQ
ncbi:hypothetical protein ACRRTK_006241 [Alexandromys fortis]